MRWLRSYIWLWLALVVPVGDLAAQTELHPESATTQIKVQAVQLDGFVESAHHHLGLQELRLRLAQERARFGVWLSVDQLHEIADALTLFIRSRGYVFHSVYLAPQSVQAGLVILTVQPGVLADIHVINQSSWPDRIFRRPLRDLTNQLLYAPAIEQRVQALKMQGGYSVFAFFSRGVKANEARLNLRIETSAKRHFSLRLDNFGSPSSGEVRLLASYSEYQLTGHHDQLQLAILQAVDGVDNTYGSLHYTLPFAGLQYQLELSLSTNQFEVGDRFASLGLQGDSRLASLGLTRFLNFHPTQRSSINISAIQKESDLSSTAGSAQSELSRTLNLAWHKRTQARSGSWLWQTEVALDHGEFGAQKSALDQRFTKVSMAHQWLLAKGQQRWRNLWQVSVRGQYSSDPLPSVEGLALTGIYGVRGFAPGLYSGDSGALISLEWRWPNLLQASTSTWRLDPFLLADWGHGEERDLNSSRAEYSAVGLGLRLNLGKHLTSQVTFAKGLKGAIDSAETETNEQLLFELRWQ